MPYAGDFATLRRLYSLYLRPTMTTQTTSVVVIGYVWPEPNSSAAGQNMLALLELFLRNGYDVTFMTAASDSVHKADLQALGVAVLPVALNCSSFDDQLTACQPDVVVFDRYMSEEQFSWRVRKVCPNALRILNTEDLHCLRQARHDAVKAGNSASQAILNTPLAHREMASILRSDLTLVVSSAEQQILIQQLGIPASQVFHHPLPLSATGHSTPGWQARRDFVCIGNFRHAPNWDAVVQLKQHIWPGLRKKVGNATLNICGAYPPKKATQLHAPDEGFVVKGWVDDAAATLAEARVLLAPVRFGAGIKGKLLLAMETGTPSVTTPIGAEGLTGDTDWPGAIATTNDTFIEAAAQLYNDQTSWQRAQHAGQACLTTYRPADADEVLALHINTLRNDLVQHRQHLYLQGLVWHHTLASTRYMSQWIEAKNRVSLPDEGAQ